MTEMTLDGIALPGDWTWADEWSYSPWPEEASQSISGALIVERGPAALAGRPVTISAAADGAWLHRDTLAALRATLDAGALPLVLWDARELDVQWRLADGPIEATEIVGTDYYQDITLRLREV